MYLFSLLSENAVGLVTPGQLYDNRCRAVRAERRGKVVDHVDVSFD